MKVNYPIIIAGLIVYILFQIMAYLDISHIDRMIDILLGTILGFLMGYFGFKKY